MPDIGSQAKACYQNQEPDAESLLEDWLLTSEWERLGLQDRYYWAALHMASNIGPSSLLHLYGYFRNGEAALKARAAELQQVPKLSPQALEKILFFQ